MPILKHALEGYLIARGLTAGVAVAAVYRYAQSYWWSCTFNIDRETSRRGIGLHVEMLLDFLKEEMGLDFGTEYAEVSANGKPHGQFE